MAKADEILSKRNMRLMNIGAITLVTIAWLIRFYYMTERETVDERTVETVDPVTNSTVTNTELVKTYEQDGFWFIMYTLFIFPILIALFIITEIHPVEGKLASLCKGFHFLDYHIGKALFLLLCATFIWQHTYVVEWLINIAIMIVVIVNFVHPCLLGAQPINGNADITVFKAKTDHSIAKELEKVEKEEAAKRVVKKKDPANTEKVRQELETEGQSIVDEKTSEPIDAKSGKGTLKVRF